MGAAVGRRKSAFGRLLDHFHTHPRGRLHEVLFWGGLGVLLGGLALAGWRFGYVSDPIAWMLGVIALCFVLFALLPQRKPRRVAEPPAGRLRAEKAAAVRASKEEGKRARAAKRGERR